MTTAPHWFWSRLGCFASALAVALMLSAGCGGSKGDGDAPATSGAGGTGEAVGQADAQNDSQNDGQNGGGAGDEAGEAPELKPLEPYDAPPLEELDAQVTWIDQPVVDSLQKLRDYYQDKPPLVSVAQALSMRNNSPADNTKIVSAIGRPAPADGQGVDWDGVFTRSINQDLRSMNPLMASSTAEFEINSLTGFGMFSFDWEMTPHAMAEYVESWQTSEDGMYDKVVMRDDITWSDGKPITAHDVVFSFQTIMNPKVPIPAVRQGTEELRWVEAYDDRTLVYFHKKAQPINVWNLNYPVIPKHVFEDSVERDPTLRTDKVHVDQEEAPVTGGPYEVHRRTRGSEIVLRRRESYYMHDGEQVRSKPYFKEMRFKIMEDGNTRRLALEVGDLDEAELVAQQWVTQTDTDDFYKLNTKISGAEWTFFYFGWNLKTPYFSDKRVRQAMSHAFNHQEMLEDLCYGLYEPCHGIYHPSSWMFPKNPSKPIGRYNVHDLDRAEDLLDEAGWEDSDDDGIRDKVVDGEKIDFEFSIIVSNKPDRVAICNLLRENLETIGVICNVKPLEASTMQKFMFDKTYEAAMSGWGTGADPYTNENLFGTGEGRNYGSYSNKQVDQWFKDAMVEFDRDKRGDIYAKIYEQTYEDQVYTFLYYRSAFYGINERLRGFHFSPRGPYHYGPGISAIHKAQP